MAGNADHIDLTKSTQDVFQPRAGRHLSEEDIRVISHNLTGFFSVLGEWAAAEVPPPSAIATPDEQSGPVGGPEGGGQQLSN
ncbi:MAG: hypothetical protein RIC12_00065 [Pirellulales bacterium]